MHLLTNEAGNDNVITNVKCLHHVEYSRVATMHIFSRETFMET